MRLQSIAIMLMGLSAAHVSADKARCSSDSMARGEIVCESEQFNNLRKNISGLYLAARSQYKKDPNAIAQLDQAKEFWDYQAKQLCNAVVLLENQHRQLDSIKCMNRQMAMLASDFTNFMTSDGIEK